MIVQEQVELDVDVRPLAIDPAPGVTHDAEFFPLPDRLALRHRDRAEMRVEAVIRRAAPAMLDHDVAA